MNLITATVTLTNAQWMDLMHAAHATHAQWQEDLREAEENNWPESEIRDARTGITESETLIANLGLTRLPEGLLGDLYRNWVYDQLRACQNSIRAITKPAL